MEVTSSTTTTATATGTVAAAASVSGDFETFLNLLTTQMRNQDPLNPTDSTEFVSQLASFSAVEQQVQSNETLESILGALSSGSGLHDLATWIGKEVMIAGSADFAGAAIEVATAPPVNADGATLTVTNDFGQIIRTQTVDPTATTLSWNGTDSEGGQADHGAYSFLVTYTQGDATLGTVDGNVYVEVTEARVANGDAVLISSTGEEILLSLVNGVRAAET